MTILILIGGLALLLAGGEMLVRGAVAAAARLGVSPLLAGLVIVGFGTSTPELVTSLLAAMAESPGIAIGNVVGSNTANILLILGISALLAPIAAVPAAFRRDGLALGLSALLCLGVVLIGSLDRLVGAALLALLAGYVIWAYRAERRVGDAEAVMHEHVAADAAPGALRLWPALVLTVIGLAATILGARLLVDAAIELARSLGVSDAVIGLTVVAVGTSLPEMAACVIAALRRHSDVALGNVVGSNIYNVLGILGVTALVHPLEVPPAIVRFDIWVLLGATALLLVFLRAGLTLHRWQGGVFLGLYAAYLLVLLL
ncbi:MAG: calcium/sodium antiporter [Parasphingopyxis sp.]|uniref:calcium/sodium antiporter n=1 Tax=Parasphingopyxis sp. TaxID=1920299 RepID=UPI003FA14EA0